jgi:ATP-dependent DNA helicase PIF1
MDLKKETPKLEFTKQFNYALDLLENSQKNLFVTGRAGTGKSTLLQYFRDGTNKNVIVLAPTGVAAVNIKGQTIHSFFQFRPDVTPETVYDVRLSKPKRKLFKELDAIVIDEISMVRADLLDCIDAFLKRYGKHRDLPFGGVQMVFFGDLYQLPPVVTRNDKELFSEHYPSPYFFDAKCYSYLNLKIIELDKIYRQNEKDFIRLLGKIRENTVTSSDMEELNSRHISEFESSLENFYIYLTTTNKMADQVNQKKLVSLKTASYRLEGEVIGAFDMRSLPTHEHLDLKFNAQIMLLNNDPFGRWINGSIGKIISVDQNKYVINVELSDGKVVEVEPFTWEMYRFFYNEDEQKVESESVGSFTQFPLKLAWAVTIHKSQGKTFSNVVVDIGYGTFSHGQVYVAISRCTNFKGLILKRPIAKKHIMLDRRVVNFMDGYKKEESKDLVENLNV